MFKIKDLHKHPLWLIILFGAASLAVAYVVFQKLLGLEPCPLCILDRIAIVIIMLGALACLVQLRLLNWLGLALMPGGLGLGFASTLRHVWLERHPESASCLFPSQKGGVLEFVLDAFAGTADCASVSFRLFGLSIAEMTLLVFCLLATLVVWSIVRCVYLGRSA